MPSFFRPTLKYGPHLSFYDGLKLVALLTMIIDHIGFYFYPEVDILRVIGRIAAPVFFFLVGYSTERRLSPTLWLGGTILAIHIVLFGFTLLPLNILFTILAIRFLLRFLEDSRVLRQDLIMAWVAILIFYPLSNAVLEYGSTGLMFALIGVFVRTKEISGLAPQMFCGLTLAFWVLRQSTALMLDLTHSLLLLMIVTVQFYLLTNADFTRRSARPAPYPALFLARHTLLLYVAHIILFQWIIILRWA